MPRYFIDTDDNFFAVRDDQGQNFPGSKAAREMVHRVLPEMARQKMPVSDHHVFRASVRDESGAVLYMATLTLVGEWMVDYSSL